MWVCPVYGFCLGLCKGGLRVPPIGLWFSVRAVRSLPLFHLPTTGILGLQKGNCRSIVGVVVAVISGGSARGMLSGLDSTHFDTAQISAANLFLRNNRSYLFVNIRSSGISRIFRILRNTMAGEIIHRRNIGDALRNALLRRPISIRRFNNITFIVSIRRFGGFWLGLVLFGGFVKGRGTGRRVSGLCRSNELPRTVILRKRAKLNGQALTESVTRTLIYETRDRRPYNIYSRYMGTGGRLRPSVCRCDTPNNTGSFRVSGVESVVTSICVAPGRTSCGVCVLNGTRYVGRGTRGTLLGVLRRPPNCTIFVLATRGHSTLLRAILSETIIVSIRNISPGFNTRFVAKLGRSISCGSTCGTITTLNKGVNETCRDVTNNELRGLATLISSVTRGLTSGGRCSLLGTITPLANGQRSATTILNVLGAILHSTITNNGELSNLSGTISTLGNRFSGRGLFTLCGTIRRLRRTTGGGTGSTLLAAGVYCSLQETTNE